MRPFLSRKILCSYFMKQIANQKGSVLLFVLVAVAILGLMAGIAGSSWKTITQRAKEEELLWRGNQYRKAIGAYYTAWHAGMHAVFPQTLEQLTRDPRMLGTVRYIRRLYLDPITGKSWIPIKDSTGRIRGVHSSSQLEPYKKGNFSKEDEDFAGKKTYAEWQFIYTPKAQYQTKQPVNKTKAPASGSGNEAQKN